MASATIGNPLRRVEREIATKSFSVTRRELKVAVRHYATRALVSLGDKRSLSYRSYRLARALLKEQAVTDGTHLVIDAGYVAGSGCR